VGQHRIGYNVSHDVALRRARWGGFVVGASTTLAIWMLASWGPALWTWLWTR
jgi:hypothetical protein